MQVRPIAVFYSLPEKILIHLHGLLYDVINGKLSLNKRPPPRSHLGPQIRIFYKVGDGPRDSSCIVRWDKKAIFSILHNFPAAGHVGGDNGPTAGGRFDEHLRDSLSIL
jgi:hypothetical protein